MTNTKISKILAKTVAVIIPVYKNDRLHLIRKAVDSIRDQSYEHYQLFIAVDGPIPNKIRNYFDQHNSKTFHVLYYDENRGLATILNESIKVVKEMDFPFIARMDADDTVHTERLTRQIEFLEKHPDVMVLGTQGYIINSDDNIIGVKNTKPVLNYKILRNRSDIIHASVIFRSTFFDEVGFYDPNYPLAEDHDLWFRAAQKGIKMRSIPDRLYNFRHDHMIVNRRQSAQKAIIQVKRKYLSLYEYYYLLPNYLIRFLPENILKIILQNSMKPGKGERLLNGQG